MSELTKQLIYDMYVKLLHLNEQKADTDLKAFLKQAAESDVKRLPGNMTTIHVISCIGHDEPINNTGIAKNEFIKSKYYKNQFKAVKRRPHQTVSIDGQQKEIYFRLTPSGKQVFELHEKLHQQKRISLADFSIRFQQQNRERF